METLAGDCIVDKWSPEREAVIESASRVLAACCLETNARINTARAHRNVRRHEIVKQDSNPLSGSRATAVESGLSRLRDIICAWSDRGGDIRSLCTPVVDQDFL